jgi:nitroimidazol reductase NimA-like FMN-containing flavoprotein (pyridoxamine 5'-phosphate oxidase superfamily)
LREDLPPTIVAPVTATYEPTPRTTHRRLAERGSHERDEVNAILDEGLLAHVGLVDGEVGPVVLPMTFARIGDHLYLHGALANRLLRRVAEGAPVCLTVTILDGLVLARSAFHHSMNYRCAVVFGSGERVTDRDEMLAASDALVERMRTGRSAEARRPSEAELRKTLIVRIPLVEASAKTRTGGPVDDEEDLTLPVWAGVVPIAQAQGSPIPS